MKPSLGAVDLGGGRWRFLLWAPLAEAVDLRIVSPHERIARMEKIGTILQHFPCALLIRKDTQ